MLNLPSVTLAGAYRAFVDYTSGRHALKALEVIESHLRDSFPSRDIKPVELPLVVHTQATRSRTCPLQPTSRHSIFFPGLSGLTLRCGRQTAHIKGEHIKPQGSTANNDSANNAKAITTKDRSGVPPDDYTNDFCGFALSRRRLSVASA